MRPEVIEPGARETPRSFRSLMSWAVGQLSANLSIRTVVQTGGPDRDPELALGHEAGSGRSDRGLGRVGTGTGLSEPGSADDAPVGPDGDLEDFGLLTRSAGCEGRLTGGAGPKGRIIDLDRGREIGVTGASRTFASGLLTFFRWGRSSDSSSRLMRRMTSDAGGGASGSGREAGSEAARRPFSDFFPKSS